MCTSGLKSGLGGTSPEMPGKCLWLLNDRRVPGNMGSRSCGCSSGNQGWVGSTICTDCNQGRDFLSKPGISCTSGCRTMGLSFYPFSSQRGLLLSRALAPTSPHSSKADGLRFKGESRAGNALIPRDGPAEECYRIFPWLFLLKHVHKQQHWVMQPCLSAFSCSRQGAAGVI